MKYLLLTLNILAFFSCQTKETKVVENPVSEVNVNIYNETETQDEFCDTSKIKDFTSNLTILTQELTVNENKYQFKQAKDFINKSCERDTLFCGEINFKKSTTYFFDNEWKLLLTGYVLEQATGLEDNSASFFVLTIMRNNKPWFSDILEDLMGEIQVELNGFENKDIQITVWGHAYPYFQSDYGKFRLIIKDGKSDYEFQCHSKN